MESVCMLLVSFHYTLVVQRYKGFQRYRKIEGFFFFPFFLSFFFFNYEFAEWENSYTQRDINILQPLTVIIHVFFLIINHHALVTISYFLFLIAALSLPLYNHPIKSTAPCFPLEHYKLKTVLTNPKKGNTGLDIKTKFTGIIN